MTAATKTVPDTGGPPLSSLDKEIMSMKEDDFHIITWADLTRIILVTNSLQDLKRGPTALRAYHAWSAATKKTYGTITAYVLRERLHWTPLDPSAPQPTFSFHTAAPFADPRDYQILRNDWPYGVTPGIAHLVAWTRAPIPVDSGVGDVTPASRAAIEAFVKRVFVADMQRATGDGEGRVLWFKNWVSLQSVRGVDHVHVMVRDPPEEVLEAWLARTVVEDV